MEFSKLRKKKILIVFSTLLIIFSATAGALLINNSFTPTSDGNSKVLGDNIISSPIDGELTTLQNTKESKSQEESSENSTNSQNAQTSSSPQAVNNQLSCTPSLKAIIVRPYTYNNHLGDDANKISGSYESNCIDTGRIIYEWFIWGGTHSIPYTKFSNTAKPNFSQYSPGTYDVLYRVSASGISSELKTWVFINAPQPPKVDVPNSAPSVNLYKPISSQYHPRIVEEGQPPYIRLDLSGDAFDPRGGDGKLTGNSIEWFVELSNGRRDFLGYGESLVTNYVLPQCSVYIERVIMKAKDSTGLASEISVGINSPNDCPMDPPNPTAEPPHQT